MQRFSGDNQMNTHNLAIVFGPTLFQTDGKDYKAGRVVEDLISHYVKIFNVGFGPRKLPTHKALPPGGSCCRTPGTRRVAPQGDGGGMGAAGGRWSCSSHKSSLFWRHTAWGLHPRDPPRAPLLGRSTTRR